MDADWEFIDYEPSRPPHLRPLAQLHFGHSFSAGLRRGDPRPRSDDPQRLSQRRIRSPADPAHAQSQCAFFHLPAELRLRIYEELFSFQDPIAVTRATSPSVLSILASCRRVLDEAEPIFYAINAFECSSTQLDGDFLQSLGLRRRTSMCSVVLPVASAGETLAFLERLLSASSLRELEIRRKLSTQYINVGEWKLLSGQLKEKLAEFPSLKSVRVYTPEITVPLDSAAQAAVDRLRDVDRGLHDVVREPEHGLG